MFFVYIIQSNTSGRFYIGQTQNLHQRIHRHNAGQCAATRNKGPWTLRCSLPFQTRAEAIAEERRLKAMKSHRYLQQLIDSTHPNSG